MPIEPREIIGRSLGLDERSDKSSAKPPSLTKAPSPP
jgi:hypothetical protein